MTEEILDLARRLGEAFNVGLDEFMALHAEDVVHVTAPEWPEGGTYVGREAVRELWAAIFAAQAQEIEVEDVIAVDESRALSKLCLYSRGASSGIRTATPIYSVGTMRDGLLSRIEYFTKYEQALAAAGPESDSLRP